MENELLWSQAERLAWRPPENLRPSEWAERYRILSRRQSSRPGPWDNRNAPILVGIMDLCGRPGVQEIWIKKAAQVGVSEAIRNVLGWLAAHHPDPVLIVLPNEKVGRKITGKRLIPLFEDTPCLAALATRSSRDKKLTQISLANGFDLQLGWSGSPASLASDPFRVAILDEVDKYERHIVGEAPPEELARVRTRTYGSRALIVGLSTPTTREGPISREYEACPIKLFYFCPCPHCRRFQRLTPDGLKWEPFRELADNAARSNRIRSRKAAWYECAACRKRIGEEHKRAMLWAGYWGTEDGGWKSFCDGREEGQFPEGNRVGIHAPAQYDLSTRWWQIAADTVEAGTDPGKIQHLRNSTLAETFEQQITAVRADAFSQRCRAENGAAPAQQVPKWATRLLMAIDTQKDHFWFVIRAWGAGYRSRRIHHGRVTSFDELALLADQTYWPYEAKCFPAIRVHTCGIDSGAGKAENTGSRTDEVYRWCLADSTRRKPLKGESQPRDVPIRPRRVTYSPPDRRRDPYQIWLHLLDTHHYQDLLASAIDAKISHVDPETGEVDEAAEDLWQLNSLDDPDYNRHLSNLDKVLVKPKRGRAVERWVPKTSGARVDYRMCEGYQYALASGMALCAGLPTPEAFAAQLQAAERERRRPPTGVKSPDGRPFLVTNRR